MTVWLDGNNGKQINKINNKHKSLETTIAKLF